MRFDQPQWHKLFPLGTSVTLISSVIRSYCRAALFAVRRAGADRSGSDAPPLVFEEVAAATPPANDTPSIDAISTPSIDAPIPAQLAYAAAKVFGKSALRPRQVIAVNKLVYCQSSKGKLLVVDRTGGGKSLILSLVAVMVGGISLVIIPLLALTANQMSKLKEAISDHGAIEVHHLDELKKSSVNKKLIPRMLAMPKDSSTTMFILTSPQYLAENSLIRNALVQCQARQTLRLVAIDEIHLYTQHGQTFRECIRYLRDVFFCVVFDNAKPYHPLFLGMTATFTQSMVKYFSYLTSVEWGYCPNTRLEDGSAWGGTNYPHQLWSSLSDFRQRYIKMGLAVSGDIGQVALPKLITHLKDNPNSYAAMYVNFKAETSKWASKLEGLIATALMSIDVLQINGDMDKVEKFFFIRLFTRAIANPLFIARVLVATAAANTGIDQEMLDFVLRVGLPRCIITALQERGRNARKEGMFGFFIVYTSWLLFIKLMLTILAMGDSTQEAADQGESINTMIQALSPLKRTVANAPRHPRRPLTKSQKHDNMVEAYNNLIDVVSLYFLPGLGCVHSRMEWFMATGELIDPPPMILPCVTQCFVCDKTYEKYILPIIYEGALEFLSSKVLTDKLPFEISLSNCDELLDTLYKEESWLIRVFGILTVKKYNVASFFFQLIGSKMLSFEIKGKGSQAVILFTRDKGGQYSFKNIVNWEGFLFRTKDHGRAMVRMTFGDLLQKNAHKRWSAFVSESSGLN